MFKGLRSPEVFWGEVVATWRVFALVALAQVVGAFISLHRAPIGSRFVDFWFGGAVATLPGVLLGLIWQFSSLERRNWYHRDILLFYLLIAIGLLVAAFTFPLREMAGTG